MARGGKSLTDEDRVLWNLVASSTVPLKGKVRQAEAKTGAADETSEAEETAIAKAPAAVVAARQPEPAKKQHVAHSIDAPMRDKIAKGRVAIGGRVDLHGMTQNEAHNLLLAFLRTAHDRDLRYVLVITGKGSSSGGAGVLRRSVPNWLTTAPFRTMVSGYDEAARHHGGAGALYVRLRRKG
jgi:DNA-nicking Smr family endonuclease